MEVPSSTAKVKSDKLTTVSMRADKISLFKAD
jgi:hypothetical protein